MAYFTTGYGHLMGIQWQWWVVSTPLKHMKVNGKDYPIYEMENKKCLKPPTRHVDVNICEHTQQKKDF
jgi:hypothetical protein